MTATGDWHRAEDLTGRPFECSVSERKKRDLLSSYQKASFPVASTHFRKELLVEKIYAHVQRVNVTGMLALKVRLREISSPIKPRETTAQRQIIAVKRSTEMTKTFRLKRRVKTHEQENRF